MSESKPFLDVAPDGFEPTCELAWIGCPVSEWQSLPTFSLNNPSNSIYAAHPCFVLCQKWRGAFRDCWVRIQAK